MKDSLSRENLQKAAEELMRMQESTHPCDEKEEAYKCTCRFEKKKQTASHSQNGICNHNINKKTDEDKLLILALILILAKNSDDKFLLFALLYIIM